MARATATSRGTATARGFRSSGGTGGGGTPPPDGSPSITAGPTLVTRTTSSITLEWTADQFVQSWVEYGTTAGYGSESAHETSFDFQTHRQTISGLAPATTYHFKVHVVNQAAQETTSSDATFDTATPDPDPGGGINYTRYSVPTGAGWTDGTDVATKHQQWFNDTVPNGAGTADHSEVYYAPGFTWTSSKSLKFNGRSHITFNGGGTAAFQTDPTTGLITLAGNTGGGKIKRTHVGTGGDVTNFPAFSTGQGGTAYRATDIRFVNLQVEGGMSPAIDLTTSMANGGNEYASAFDFYGLDGGAVINCNVYRTTGDAVVLYGAAGALTGGTGTGGDPYVNPNDARTRNVLIQYNWFRSTGRVGVFLGKCQGIDIVDNLFQDSAYAFIDFEPDYWHMKVGATTINRNSFTGACNWGTGTFMAAIFMTRVTNRALGPDGGWYFDGTVGITNNVFASAHKRTDAGTQPAGTSGKPDIHGTYGPIIKQGAVTITGNRRISSTYTGPAVVLANCSAGGTITNNTGFGATPTFASISSSGSFTQSGNS